jgi:hypothetical protein
MCVKRSKTLASNAKNIITRRNAMSQDLKDTKLEAHLDALEKHKALLEKLHLNNNQHLDEVSGSLEQLTLTLEEYLKIIGIP